MRYNIYFIFEDEAEAHLEALRIKLSEQVAGVSDATGKMRPHLSLLVFDNSDQAHVLERFQDYANTLHSFSLRLKTISAFTGQRNVLYVEPVISDELENNYRVSVSHFSNSDIVAAYRDIDKWKPHITLAKGLNDSAFNKAKELAVNSWSPIDARVNSVGLINVQKPLQVLAITNLVTI